MSVRQDAKDRIQPIPIDKIEVYISRKRNNKGHNLLTESIKKYGLLIPITVVKQLGGRYKLVKGEGRLEAHKKIGRSRIKAFVFSEKELQTKDIIENWLIENEVRDQLSNLDKARLMKMEFEKNNSYEDTAKIFLTSRSIVKQYIKVLDQASEKIIGMVDKKEISFSQAKELAMTVKTKEAQESVADLVVKHKLSQPETRVVLKTAKTIEKKRQKVTIQLLEKNLVDLRAQIRDSKILLGALQQRYNRLVPHIRGLLKDPEFLGLLKKRNLPIPIEK